MSNRRKSQSPSSLKEADRKRQSRNDHKDTAKDDNSKFSHNLGSCEQPSVGHNQGKYKLSSVNHVEKHRPNAMARSSIDNERKLSATPATVNSVNSYLSSAMDVSTTTGVTVLRNNERESPPATTRQGGARGYRGRSSAKMTLDDFVPNHHVVRLKKTNRPRKRDKQLDSNQIGKQNDESDEIAKEKSKYDEVVREAEDIFRGLARANVMFERPLKCALGLVNSRLKATCNVSEEITPFQYFCREQVILWLQTIRDMLERRALIYLDLEEMFISLYELYLIAERKYPMEAHYIAMHVRNIGIDISYAAALMARLANVETFDFMRLAESINAAPRDGTPYSYLIPRMQDFKLHHLIALGRCSRVYKVTHRSSLTVCAMDISTVMTERELIVAGGVLSLIHHCCVATPFARFQAGGQMVSLFEYCWGLTLENVVAESSYFSVDTFRAIAAQLISAVKHIHGCGVMHRALTTDNVIMERSGRVKLVGFHNACICLAHIPKRSQLVFQERRIGEFSYDVDFNIPTQYMPPEMVLKRSYGRSSDWWTLGVTLYRTFTKIFPFDGADDAQIRRAIYRNPLVFPDRDGVPVSGGAKEFLQCLLTKKPRGRCMYGDRVDLYKHPFIVGVDWKKLSTTDKLFPQPDGYCKLLQRTVPPRFRRTDLTESEQAALSPKAVFDDIRPHKLGNPTKLEDVPYPQVSTFISPVFRKALEVFRFPKKLGRGPLLKVMGYNASSPALSIPDTFDLDRYNAERLVITIPKRNIFELGIHIESAIGEDNCKYFYVTRFSDSFYYDSLPLIEGDFLLAMNNTSLINEVMATVKAKLAFHQHDVTTFIVQSSSPFRLAAMYPDFGCLLKSLPRISVGVNPAQFLEFRCLVRTQIVGYTDGWVVNAAHFVWKTSGKQRLFVGDVIQTVDGIEAITLSTEELDAYVCHSFDHLSVQQGSDSYV